MDQSPLAPNTTFTPNPEPLGPPPKRPFYKQKQWIVTIAVVVIAMVGVLVGTLLKQAADQRSIQDAKAAASDYTKATPASFNAFSAYVANASQPTQADVDKIQQLANDRPRLAAINGPGADLDEYKDAKRLDERVGAYYQTVIETYKQDILPFQSYAAGVQSLTAARDRGTAAVSAAATGGAQAAVTAIRTTAIPTIQDALDSFKKIKAPRDASVLTPLVIKTHEDFIAGLESFAKEIESGNIQNHDFSAQINQINTELQSLTNVIQQKYDGLKTTGANIQKDLS